MNVAKGRKEKRERRLWVRGKVRAEIGEFLGIRRRSLGAHVE